MGITYFKLIHLNYQIKSFEKQIQKLEAEDNIENFSAINALQKSIDKKKSLMKELEKPYNN